jgi:purine nucleoside phosphorylase
VGEQTFDTWAAARRAADVLVERAGRRPTMGLVCGTGFAACSDVLSERVTIPFDDLGLRPSRIPDHVNEVDVGTVDGVVVAAVKAKSLTCDGATWQEAGLPVRTLAAAGCTTLLYSANSGSMREDVPPGSFLAFTDHLNFSGMNPLSTEREGGPWGTTYLSMAELYDETLTIGMCDAAAEAGVGLPVGVAGYWMGPSFETPAEIRLARLAGCAISSNSFLPETMAAYHAGMRVVAFTFVSTWSAGIGAPIVLAPVVDLAHRHHDDFRTIVRAAIPVLAAAEPRPQGAP